MDRGVQIEILKLIPTQDGLIKVIAYFNRLCEVIDNLDSYLRLGAIEQHTIDGMKGGIVLAYKNELELLAEQKEDLEAINTICSLTRSDSISAFILLLRLLKASGVKYSINVGYAERLSNIKSIYFTDGEANSWHIVTQVKIGARCFFCNLEHVRSIYADGIYAIKKYLEKRAEQ
nr:MAG TPA: hypothetical protein [Caudoviricetes sp.]